MSPCSARDGPPHRSREAASAHPSTWPRACSATSRCASASAWPRPAPQRGSRSSIRPIRRSTSRHFAAWLRAHGQSQNAIDSLWNLIALPTLNLPAEDASLAVAAKVFRTGLLDDADASDIGVPAVPFRLLHAEPAAAAIEAAGGRVQASTPVRSVSPDRRITLDGRTDEADAVILAVPHEAVAESRHPAPSMPRRSLGSARARS